MKRNVDRKAGRIRKSFDMVEVVASPSWNVRDGTWGKEMLIKST